MSTGATKESTGFPSDKNTSPFDGVKATAPRSAIPKLKSTTTSIQIKDIQKLSLMIGVKGKVHSFISVIAHMNDGSTRALLEIGKVIATHTIKHQTFLPILSTLSAIGLTNLEALVRSESSLIRWNVDEYEQPISYQAYEINWAQYINFLPVLQELNELQVNRVYDGILYYLDNKELTSFVDDVWAQIPSTAAGMEDVTRYFSGLGITAELPVGLSQALRERIQASFDCSIAVIMSKIRTHLEADGKTQQYISNVIEKVTAWVIDNEVMLQTYFYHKLNNWYRRSKIKAFIINPENSSRLIYSGDFPAPSAGHDIKVLARKHQTFSLFFNDCRQAAVDLLAFFTRENVIHNEALPTRQSVRHFACQSTLSYCQFSTPLYVLPLPPSSYHSISSISDDNHAQLTRLYLRMTQLLHCGYEHPATRRKFEMLKSLYQSLLGDADPNANFLSVCIKHYHESQEARQLYASHRSWHVPTLFGYTLHKTKTQKMFEAMIDEQSSQQNSEQTGKYDAPHKTLQMLV